MPQRKHRKYALADYSVELRERGWYFGRQYQLPGEYRGPYASISSVTLMIARQLQREIIRRDGAARASDEAATNGIAPSPTDS